MVDQLPERDTVKMADLKLQKVRRRSTVAEHIVARVGQTVRAEAEHSLVIVGIRHGGVNAGLRADHLVHVLSAEL